MKKKRVEITAEVKRTLILKESNAALPVWCSQCNHQVGMILPTAAAALAGISVREIFRRVEAGDLHFLETSEGQIRICFDSINRA